MNSLVLQHVSYESPGLLAPMLGDLGVSLRIINLNRGQRLPDRLDGTDILIVMGGPMNVYEEDEYPYLRQEDVLLRQAISDDVPVLGVCLGAQLLAKAAGARVYPGPVEEFGWSDVELTPAGLRDPLLAGLGPRMPVFQWHQDTFDVPAGGELLATSPIVPNQAFRAARRAYGLQFHVEVDRHLLGSWMNVVTAQGPRLDALAVRQITETFDLHEEALTHQAATVVRNFRNLAQAV